MCLDCGPLCGPLHLKIRLLSEFELGCSKAGGGGVLLFEDGWEGDGKRLLLGWEEGTPAALGSLWGQGLFQVPSKRLSRTPRPGPLCEGVAGGREPQLGVPQQARGRAGSGGRRVCGLARVHMWRGRGGGGVGGRGGGFTSRPSSRMVAASQRPALFLPARLSPSDPARSFPGKMPGAPQGRGAAWSRCAVRGAPPGARSGPGPETCAGGAELDGQAGKRAPLCSARRG
jgi:hypothetical protein